MRISAPRRLFFSLLIVLLWLGFLTEGSRALLSDTSGLTGNTLTTGTAQLLVSNSQAGSSNTYAKTRPGFAVQVNPGEGTDRYFFLKNTSESTVPLLIDAVASVQDGVGPVVDAVSLEFTPVDSEGAVTGAPLVATLRSLTGQHTSLGVTIPPSATQRFKLRTLVDTDFPNQATAVTYDITFTGTQHNG